ncbi:hypothetical protein U1Q18_029758, partial [Sarracenia purpurea var. burkii]
FLDKAAMVDEIDKSSNTRNPWRLCSVSQVENVKLLFRLMPIWLSCLMFGVVNAQFSTYFTKQGSTMIRTIGPHFHMPPASLQVFTGLTILAAVPIYERVFIPAARKITGQPSGITMLQRIGIGIFLSLLTMVVSSLVEAKRVRIARHHGLINAVPKSSPLPMRVWWLLPQYILAGLSDVFAVVGLQELFYDQMPEEMRSMGAAAHITVLGVGNFLSSAVISVVQAISSRFGDEWLSGNLNQAHLDYFYWVLAGLSAVNLCIYVLVAMRFVYKKTESDDPIKGAQLELHGYRDGEI